MSSSNPHPDGSTLAALWNVGEAWRRFGLEAREEALETARRLGRLLPRGRRLAELEARVRILGADLRVAERIAAAEGKQLDALTADVDELIGIAAAAMPWTREAELADLLAADPPARRQARREGLEAALELRQRVDEAAAAKDLAIARQGIALTLGHRVESSSDEPAR